MKSILTLVGIAIALDNYAKSLEVKSKELDIAGFNVKRASLFLHKLQKEFTDSVGLPADFDIQDVNVLDFGIKIAELKEDIEAHVKSLDIANLNYARLINNALSAIEEAELWFDDHIMASENKKTELLLTTEETGFANHEHDFSSTEAMTASDTQVSGIVEEITSTKDVETTKDAKKKK